ncbi:F-box/kelch-repeat protein SKIP30-like [Macadamia integrifolia]|uniref:F-box/kelch-repeat protein SKIP30-like n=1 Tax=Macadamia integrifolia TaxID=60698 RepID=UPI001C52F2B3|nr:F-box/kelch-repeat protein SKIP30-like [Macadamia integrifolia]
MSGLIEGLPDELVFLCLAWLPFNLYPVLQLVCRSWRAAIHSPELIKARLEVSAHEFLCVCTGVEEKLWQLYDPLIDDWLTLPDLPTERDPVHFGFVSTAGKLFVLGGDCSYWDDSTNRVTGEFATDRVWSYDHILGCWDQRASMLVPRSNFASCVLDGKIIAAGGLKTMLEPISNAEIYDPETDVWAPLPDLPKTGYPESGVVINGKLHVFFDGESKFLVLENGGGEWTWVVRENELLKGPKAIVGEDLYVLKDGIIFKLDKELKIPKRVVEAPPDCSYFFIGCHFTMIGIGPELFLVGEEEIYVLAVGMETPTIRELPQEWDLHEAYTICSCTMLLI